MLILLIICPRPIPGRSYQQIPYNFVTPKQLGSIYESFLGYQIEVAEKAMYLKDGVWKASDGSVPKKVDLEIKKGHLLFSRDNTDRKHQGTYYTPDYIVDFIVENALAPLLEGKSTEEIKKVKICDPALGSGHFINSVVRFVTRAYREAAYKTKNGTDESYESTARTILDSCIFGADIDFRAVKLAKMNLWLLTALPGKKLEHLDDQILVGDSLAKKKIGAGQFVDWNERVFAAKGFRGFDCVVGNPPYGASLSDAAMDHYSTVYELGTTDTAALMMKLGFDLVKDKGTVSMIVPKSFTYSSTWKAIRELLLPNLTMLVDVGKAWKEVKLEQAIFLAKKDKVTHSYQSYCRNGEDFKSLGKIEKDDCRSFDMYLNGVSPAEVVVAKHLLATNKRLGSISTNTRGAPLQRAVIEEKAKFVVLGGKQIGEFCVSGSKGYCAETDVHEKAKVQGNSVLVQNILAHIMNPIDHVKVIGLRGEVVPRNTLILDTVNQIKIDGQYSSAFVLGLLSSHLVNWFVYRFIVGKAIRTIHFDDPVTSRIPIPDLKIGSKLMKNIEGVVEDLEDNASKRGKEKSQREIDKLDRNAIDLRIQLDEYVYEAFSLPREMRETVENLKPYGMTALKKAS